MPSLKDKVVLITGASAGIGRAAAIAFAEEGAAVVLAARTEDRLQRLAEELGQYGVRTMTLPLDVSNRDDVFAQIDRVIESFGQIDILVNNAGIGLLSPVAEMTAADLQRVMDVNYFGLIWCTQAVLPHMTGRQSGHIINVSSIAGKRAMPYMSAYCASKFAVQAFSESLRLEVAPHRINVTTICPPRVDTEFDAAPMMQMQTGLRVKWRGITAESVAAVIVRTARNPRREVIISLSARLLALGQKISPRLMDFALKLAWKKMAR